MRNEVSAQRILDALVASVFDSGTTVALDGSFHSELADHVPQNDVKSLSVQDLLAARFRGPGSQVLDFGCGTGGHRAMLEGFGYGWRGVNYRGGMAPSAAEEAMRDSAIAFYDGVTLPYPDDTFDVVYSFQVFEHVQYIDQTFADIRRVLKPGGALVGAVSYLEQIHDYSTFNFTPYGFKLACNQGGLALGKIYPRFDVFTWMLRRLLIVTSASDENSLSSSLHEDNAIFRAFDAYSQRMNLGPRESNLLKLMFCTHFTFDAWKP